MRVVAVEVQNTRQFVPFRQVMQLKPSAMKVRHPTTASIALPLSVNQVHAEVVAVPATLMSALYHPQLLSSGNPALVVVVDAQATLTNVLFQAPLFVRRVPAEVVDALLTLTNPGRFQLLRKFDHNLLYTSVSIPHPKYTPFLHHIPPAVPADAVVATALALWSTLLPAILHTLTHPQSATAAAVDADPAVVARRSKT